MRELVRQAGSPSIELDSAGTGSWHVGSPPDHRASVAARRRGIELSGLARQVRARDFADFDLLLAMDHANMRVLQRLAPDAGARAKVRLLREFDPASAGSQDLDVPDPYYGAAGGFEEVLDLVHAACAGLLNEISSGECA
jgi:protein-tyrosine phosphatase